MANKRQTTTTKKKQPKLTKRKLKKPFRKGHRTSLNSQGSSGLSNDNVTNEIRGIVNRIDEGLCKDKTNIEGEPYWEFPSLPYPPPKPDMFAVLEKPGIHRYVLRGCFTDANGQQKCDNFNGTFCEGKEDQCINDAPGGLADFTHPMRAFDEKFLQYGFILDRCECDFDEDVLTEGPLDPFYPYPNYVCRWEKQYRTKKNFIGQDVHCCNTLTNKRCMNEGWNFANFRGIKAGEYGDGKNPCPSPELFPGAGFALYQPSEIWDGEGTCKSWYNPTVDELANKEKNNCTQYLLKWAKSCKWCKDDNFKGSNDGLQNCQSGANGCENPNVCAGSCTPNPPFDDSCTINIGYDCKLCDSPLWDHIPGGWEALADESHPMHMMAKFAYIPNVTKTDTQITSNNANTKKKRKVETYTDENGDGREDDCLGPGEGDEILCAQPTKEWNAGNPSISTTNESPSTTFMDLGPFYNRGDTHCYYYNQPVNVSKTCSEYNWVNNLNIDERGQIDPEEIRGPICNTQTWSDQKNAISDSNRPVWENSFINFEGDNDQNILRLKDCPWLTSLTKDEPPRAKTMCIRNPNLTGYGECDEETSYYADLWLQGKWDMTRYGGTIMDDGSTPEELEMRKIEALRCCIGLTPDLSTPSTDDKETELERFRGCRPGFGCPSSQGCKKLFKDMFANADEKFIADFGNAYPENFSLYPNGTNETELKNPAYYAKAYCEMMGGGSEYESDQIQSNIGFAFDKDAEVNCRKMMYNYLSKPTRTQINTDLNVQEIEYPLRIFTSTAYDWCNLDTSTELPDQRGVCDMALGKACQQLQVDGWINPTNWTASELLNIADAEGNWTDAEGNTYTDFTADRIRRTCGCFLLGANCGNRNCSVSYCGAGTDGNKGPGPVDFEEMRDSSYSSNVVNTDIDDMNEVYAFGPGGRSLKWVENIDGDTFRCMEGESCFENCNYVNFNDTCWLASPEERKQDYLDFNETSEDFTINQWACKDTNTGESCKAYRENKLGCFGVCAIGDYTQQDPVGMCGTDEWFQHRMDLNPNEREYKILKNLYEENGITNVYANRSRNWPKWQNFYEDWRQTASDFPPTSPSTTIDLGNWGSYETNSQGKPFTYGTNIVDDPDLILCTYPDCGAWDSIKPYRNRPPNSKNCGSSCSVTQQTTINNQGVIVGGIRSSLNSRNACQYSDDHWDTKAFDLENSGEYINLMGDKDCSAEASQVSGSCLGCTGDPDTDGARCTECNALLNCIYGSTVFIDSEIGDNLSKCDTSTRPGMCCLDPGKVEPEHSEENMDLIQVVGNFVSYVCGYGNTGCPEGSISLETLEAQTCGETQKCSSRQTQNACETCDVCYWVDENPQLGIEGHCKAICPKPTNEEDGWGVTIPDRNTQPPATYPTPPPTFRPTASPTSSPIGPPITEPPPSSDDKGSVGVVIGIIGGGVFLVLLFMVWYFFMKG